MNSDFLFFFAMAVVFILYWLNMNTPSPVVAIINRWVRWLVLSLCGAKIIVDYEILDRPYWSVAVALLLLWGLIESMYNWMMIKMLSMSRMPLFPKYMISREGWPSASKFTNLEAQLEEKGFKLLQSLKMQLAPGAGIASFVYQNEDSTLRLQITFLPQFRGKLVPCFSISTNTASGKSYITDNHYLPFGGYYPEDWEVVRKPWCRSLGSLLKKHQHRMAGEIPVPWDSEPLADINRSQQKLEMLNVGLGFLVEPSQQEEYGTITSNGRYRIWKEYWLLNYFGLTVRH